MKTEFAMPSVVDFAYDIIAMQRRIEHLEQELEHYKKLHEMHCETLNRSDRHTKEMIGLTFQALLDPNSVVNKGYAAIAAERAHGG